MGVGATWDLTSTVLLFFGIGILSLILAILFLPFEVTLDLRSQDFFERLSLAFTSLFGVVRGEVKLGEGTNQFRLHLFGATVLTKDLEKERKRVEKRRIEWGKILGGLKETSSTGSNLLTTLRRAISFKELSCKAEIGLEDPATTGILIGHFYAVNGFLSEALPPNTYLHVEPNFLEEKIDVTISASLRVRLSKIFIPALRFFRVTGRLFKSE